MNRFEIQPRFDYPITVRYMNSADSFRPAATASTLEEAEFKSYMESIEIDELDKLAIEPIASAVHDDEEQAGKAAEEEVVERISLAAWWVYKRQVLGRVAIGSLLAGFDKNFEIATGFIPVFGRGEGYCSVSILRNMWEKPFLVMGSAYSIDADQAAEKSALEAIQSWVGSQWYIKNNQPQAPAWDLTELQSRFVDISTHRIGDTSISYEGQATLPGDLNVQTKGTPSGYFAWVSAREPQTHNHLSLAQIAGRASNEEAVVFTRPNW